MLYLLSRYSHVDKKPDKPFRISFVLCVDLSGGKQVSVGDWRYKAGMNLKKLVARKNGLRS